MKKVLIILLCTAVAGVLSAQTGSDPVLLTVGSEKITKSEFLTVYNKNNLKKEVIDKKSLEDYLDLYIHFKLKVKEAEAQGMDTSASFITELKGYRKQLATPYLTDKDVNDKLLIEAYERMQWDIRASHILIKVGANASPADTLKAYNKIMEIRKRIVDKKEDFGKVATETSEDQSAREQPSTGNRAASKGNSGDLGYFSALDLIYPFETAAYNTKIGEVSMPVRTDFGYHIVKVTDRKPAMGKVQAAHILISIAAGATAEDSAKAETKIKEISEKIKSGSTFEEMAKQYSDDKSSSVKGGILPWFGVNRMVPEFIAAISKLNKGDVSEPVQTNYGWHIIKLTDRKPVGSYDSLKPELKVKVTKDNRSTKSKDAMIAKIKSEYKFTETPNALNEFYNDIDTTKPTVKAAKKTEATGKASKNEKLKTYSDSLFYGKLTEDRVNKLTKKMFALGDKSYTQKDFVAYLNTKLTAKNKESIPVLNKSYKLFVEESVIDYEDVRLETKYPEFKSLMKEYRDGILLFELTDEQVWSKAVKDTTGLKEFYEKNKTNYMWGDRVDATVYTCANAKIAKATRKLAKKGTSIEELMMQINKESQLNVQVESGLFQKNDNVYVDSTAWVPSVSKDMKSGNSTVIVKINEFIPKQPKSLTEARGLITADYQSYLEKTWLAELKEKYPVVVNKEVFNTIK